MTCSTADGLTHLNVAIGDAEATADRAFFERLLAPAFAMGRPDGVRFDDRATFLESLTLSPPRQTRIESTTVYNNRAVVVCTVAKSEATGPRRFRNIRIFTRQSDQSGWQMISWVNEPLPTLDVDDEPGLCETDEARPGGGA
jgi:hypothetical protein